MYGIKLALKAVANVTGRNISLRTRDTMAFIFSASGKVKPFNIRFELIIKVSIVWKIDMLAPTNMNGVTYTDSSFNTSFLGTLFSLRLGIIFFFLEKYVITIRADIEATAVARIETYIDSSTTL